MPYFTISQESVSYIIKNCISALNETLRLKKLRPCQHGEDYSKFVKELKKRFADNPNVTTQDSLMDCSKIKTQRPLDTLDKGERDDNYSGKKKHHTIKKLIISLFCGYIACSSHHFVGRVADKKVADLEEIIFPKGTYLWTDLGFIGFFTTSIGNTENGIKIMLYMSLIAIMLIYIYRKLNAIESFRIAKLKFVNELDKEILKIIIQLCQGKPELLDLLHELRI